MQNASIYFPKVCVLSLKNLAEICVQLSDDLIKLNKSLVDLRNSINLEQLAARVLKHLVKRQVFFGNSERICKHLLSVVERVQN